MPEVVQKYVDTKDFREVDKIQRSLLLEYQYDIAHYATAEEKVKAEHKSIFRVLSGCFVQIWYI